MDFVSLIIALIVVGLLVYLVDLLPIDGTFKQIIRVVAIVGFVIYLLEFFFGGGVNVGHWPHRY